MSDRKYFCSTTKGETAELTNALRSAREDKRLSAVKRIVASMSMGMEVSQFFPEVLNCVQTERLELKKLAYLYLTAQAHTKPQHAMMAVNSLMKDCTDSRPLVRAFAVRQLGYIRVPDVAEHLSEPLRSCLSDEDPYVRKTAVMCVAKLHKINPDLVSQLGLIDILKNLFSDDNPTVVVNAIVALRDIAFDEVPEFTMPLVQKLLIALTECNEWGQTFILEAISELYHPTKTWEMICVCERVVAYLAHANAAVVMAALRVLLRFLDYLPLNEQTPIIAKMSPPLATLLSVQPEIQYITLRNISLILQKRPDILNNQIRIFFIKYNDPIYVKLEKLDILVWLAQPGNMLTILEELKEYAKDVDIELVRTAVRSIGRCAIKLEATADYCVSALIELSDTKISYIVEEVIVVFRDIFRKYRGKYEGVSAKIFTDIERLENPEARAAMIWIIGEYSNWIEDAKELIEGFLAEFEYEGLGVQLSLLTTCVKMLLRNPSESADLTRAALQLSVDSRCPDLRDRGFIYWRLLSSDPEAARNIVLAERPPIADTSNNLEPSLVDTLLRQLGSLASIYHVSPEEFQS